MKHLDKLHRLYLISPELAEEDSLLKLEHAIRCGAKLIQLRTKQLDLPTFEEIATELVKKYPKVCFIINDYWEVAIRAKACGFHVGASDMELLEFKRVIKNTTLLGGVSVYDDLDRAVAYQEAGAAYVSFSSPYPSMVKEKKLTPVEIIEKAARTLTVPVYVIGGITPQNLYQIMKMKVWGVAVLSYIFKAPVDEVCHRFHKLKKSLLI